MQYCTKCILPETWETVAFDENGVCSICRQIDYRDRKVDWDERRKELDRLVERYKNQGEYDCIVPFSGGKDSTFQLWFVVRELGLKPLVVRFDHWGFRPLVKENNTRTFKLLGVDVLQFTPNWHVVRELMLESLKRTGDFCWHCHTGVYAHTMQIALRYNTPLIVWGEGGAEYASYYSADEFEEADEESYKRTQTNLGMTPDDMFEFLGGRVNKRDLYAFAYPSKQDLDRINCRSIKLGNFIRWDTKKQVEIIKRELGWQGQQVEGIPPEFDYEKIECQWQGIRDYCKFIKRGHGRTNHLACIDIRKQYLSREEGWRLAEEYDGKRPASLDRFLEILGISEQEFSEIVSQHCVDPWRFDSQQVKPGQALPDMELWDRTQIDKSK